MSSELLSNHDAVQLLTELSQARWIPSAVIFMCIDDIAHPRSPPPSAAHPCVLKLGLRPPLGDDCMNETTLSNCQGFSYTMALKDEVTNEVFMSRAASRTAGQTPPRDLNLNAAAGTDERDVTFENTLKCLYRLWKEPHAGYASWRVEAKRVESTLAVSDTVFNLPHEVVGEEAKPAWQFTFQKADDEDRVTFNFVRLIPCPLTSMIFNAPVSGALAISLAQTRSLLAAVVRKQKELQDCLVVMKENGLSPTLKITPDYNAQRLELHDDWLLELAEDSQKRPIPPAPPSGPEVDPDLAYILADSKLNLANIFCRPDTGRLHGLLDATIKWLARRFEDKVNEKRRRQEVQRRLSEERARQEERDAILKAEREAIELARRKERERELETLKERVAKKKKRIL